MEQNLINIDLDMKGSQMFILFKKLIDSLRLFNNLIIILFFHILSIDFFWIISQKSDLIPIIKSTTLRNLLSPS